MRTTAILHFRERPASRRWLSAAFLVGLATLASPPAAGQEQEQEPREPEEAAPEAEVEDPTDAPDPRDEIVQLFHEVERKLEEIDLQLADAGAGELPLEVPEDAGLDRLLRDAGENGAQVVRSIDRILEIARQMGQGSQGGGAGIPSGESPLDQPRDRSPKQRERTPQAPDEGDPSQPPQPQDGDQKEGPGHSEEPGPNRPDAPRADEPGEPVPRADDADRWGFLPERVQEVFRNQGRDDLPVQYRDWIDAYYRRLNTRRP